MRFLMPRVYGEQSEDLMNSSTFRPPKVWLQHALDKDNTLCPLSAMFPRLIIISISISIPISLFFVHFWRIAY